MLQIKSIIKKLLNELRWWNEYRNIVKEAKQYNDEYTVFLGTPIHGNLGDQAIALATYQFLNKTDSKKHILEIPAKLLRTQNHVQKFKKVIKDKTILLHGGGYLGSLWIVEEKMARDIILSYPNNRIIILPQTMYFENSEYGENVKKESIKIYDSHSNLWLCMREEQSYHLAKDILKNVHVKLIPDIVTYMDYEVKKKEKSEILLCLRSDRERVLQEEDWKYLNNILLSYVDSSKIHYTDTVVNYDIMKGKREKEVYKKLEEFSKCKLIITDRLHGMVLAAIAGTPCLALGNCNYKVKGVYNWIKNNKYIVFVEKLEKIEEQIHNLMNFDAVKYDNEPISKYFDELVRLIKQER